MANKLTNYDNATVGSGSVVNECQFDFNSFGQILTDYQSHSGAVNISTTPKVQYGYANGSANTIRSTSMTYPNGRVLTYDYGAAAGMNDVLSRIGSLIDNDGTTQLSDYSYVGLGAFVVADYTEPDVQYTLVDLAGSNDPDTGDIYSGWDRFSRVKDCRWYDYGASADIARLNYGYDRASNRLWRNDTIAQSLGVAYDELYTYDGAHRLKDMQRGTLNGSKTAVTSRNFEQCWTLDSTNNWSGFRESTNGSSWTTVQSRTANKVNEITNITNTTGSAWAATAYDAAGNMTSMPRPATLVNGYTAIYDAWNRLMAIKAGASFVQQNQYDGRHFRTVILTYAGGILSETRHSYFTSSWQCLEERTGTSTSAERQFVWGVRYIDDLIIRDRDTTGGGTLNERRYAHQDANWNMIAVATTGGLVGERYAYSQFGKSIIMSSAYVPRSVSSYDWETTFCGYRIDRSTQLYCVRNRFLHSAIGTFITRDPILYPDGANTYAAWFVPNKTDPMGMLIGTCTSQCRGYFPGMTQGPQMSNWLCDTLAWINAECCTARQIEQGRKCCECQGKRLDGCMWSKGAGFGLTIWRCTDPVCCTYECPCPMGKHEIQLRHGIKSCSQSFNIRNANGKYISCKLATSYTAKCDGRSMWRRTV